MKQISVVLLLVVLLAACSQQAPVATLDSQASQWKFLGGRLNTFSAGDSDIALRANDRPVVTFFAPTLTTTNIAVQEWNGSRWVSIGNVGNTNGPDGRPTIATRPRNALGAPTYDPVGVAWQKLSATGDGGIDIQVKLRIGNTWFNLGSPVDRVPGTVANDPAIVLDRLGLPIVAWFQSDPDPGYTIYVKRWNGQKWVRLGGALTADTFPRAGLDLSIDSKGKPVIIFDGTDDISKDWVVNVKRWNGSKWIELGPPTSEHSSGESVAVDNTDAPVITWQSDTGLYASRWNGSNWIGLGGKLNDNPIASRSYSSIAVDTSGKSVVTFDDSGRVIVKRWTGTKWELVGEALGVNNGERLGIVVNSQNKAIVTWLQNGETTADVYVKQQK